MLVLIAREKWRAREKALKYIQRERSQQPNAFKLIENDHKNISMISERKKNEQKMKAESIERECAMYFPGKPILWMKIYYEIDYKSD